MNKNKKTFSLIIIILLSFIILFVYLYSFNEAKKLASNQIKEKKALADLEIARRQLDLERSRLLELRGNSYTIQVSKSLYLKTKNLVDKTNIFFNNADTLNPKIKIKINDKIIENEINNRRLKINQLLKIWLDNNESSVETDKALISQIKTAVFYIESYVKQLENIVADLNTEDSGLSAEEINSYRNIITNSASEIKEIITTVVEAEIIINEQANDSSNTESDEINQQIEIVREAEELIIILENILNAIATSTASSTSISNTETVNTITNTSGEGISVSRRPRIVNPEPSIIYIQNPTPHKDTGVDVYTNDQMSPLQDW